MMESNKRITRGTYEPNGRTYKGLLCPVCGPGGTTATWKAHDGEEGHWCIKCKEVTVKSPVTWVDLPDVSWVPGLVEVRCCGAWMPCHGFTNTCDRCGQDWNHAGQRLAPREHWGEETGETASEILMDGDW